jgi:hydrogenase maturation protease
LVLGIGNRLLRDDGVGPYLVETLARTWGPEAGVEFVDGGTQGLSLLGFLAERPSLLILDACRAGDAPGTVRLFPYPDPLVNARKSGSAHESNAGELLAAAALTGDLPPQVWILGVEPAEIETGLEFSEAVERVLPLALASAERAIREKLQGGCHVSGRTG